MATFDDKNIRFNNSLDSELLDEASASGFIEEMNKESDDDLYN